MSDRDIEALRTILDRDPRDMRTRLKLGDLQARAGAFAEAVATYRVVAEWYGVQGFLLRAIAVEKQVRFLITTHRLDLPDIYMQITHNLAAHYEGLGLTTDAEAMLTELQTLRAGGRPYR